MTVGEALAMTGWEGAGDDGGRGVRDDQSICHCEERQRRGNLVAWANGRRGWGEGGAPRVAVVEIAALRSQ